VEFVTFLVAALRTAAQLTTRQRAYVRQVIDGMLRERSGGSPGAVLRNPMKSLWASSAERTYDHNPETRR
jgi:hypothetical protein